MERTKTTRKETENTFKLDTSYYNINPTRPEVLKLIDGLNIKNYILIRTKENFFIWQKVRNKKPVSDYIRLTLGQSHENGLFFWDLELSFKPFAYKHNHRKDAHIKSVPFKYDDYASFISTLNIMLRTIREDTRK